MRAAGRVAAGTGAIIYAYAAAGLVGGSLPAHAGWRPPARGVTVYLEDNGIHTDLVLPKQVAGMGPDTDLHALAPARDLADPRFAGHRWLAVGWGEAAFFLDTPTWTDVRPGTVLRAAIGSDRTLVHVEHVAEPSPAADGSVRKLVLRPEEYRRLVRFVRASVRPGGRVHRGYDRYDAFYEATGRYDALDTCNAWTGRALRAAGVRVGRWTPFPVTVMGWFPVGQPEPRQEPAR